jgi:hypothetical protein
MSQDTVTLDSQRAYGSCFPKVYVRSIRRRISIESICMSRRELRKLDARMKNTSKGEESDYNQNIKSEDVPADSGTFYM